MSDTGAAPGEAINIDTDNPVDNLVDHLMAATAAFCATAAPTLTADEIGCAVGQFAAEGAEMLSGCPGWRAKYIQEVAHHVGELAEELRDAEPVGHAH